MRVLIWYFFFCFASDDDATLGYSDNARGQLIDTDTHTRAKSKIYSNENSKSTERLSSEFNARSYKTKFKLSIARVEKKTETLILCNPHAILCVVRLC